MLQSLFRASRSALKREPRGHFRGSHAYADSARIRRSGSETCGEELIKVSGAANHAARFREREWSAGEAELPGEAANQCGKFLRRVGEQGARGFVAAVRCGSDYRENAGIDGVAIGGNFVADFRPVAAAQLAQNVEAEARVPAGSALLLRRKFNGGAPHIVSATFVADVATKSSGAGKVSLGVAANRRGTRAGNENDGRAGIDGRKRKLQIRQHFNRNAGKCGGKKHLHVVAVFVLAGSGESGTDPDNFIAPGGGLRQR